jgi:hypothetical protein
MDGEAAERHGQIGYLRADFGKSGGEFWATWFDNQKHLKTPAFQDCSRSLMDYLRSEILEDRIAMRIFCRGIYGVSLGERGTGFKLQNAGYTYYLRCNPGEHDYDAYLFAYDDRYLLPELAGQHELPEQCYSVLPSCGKLIMLVRGESGYVECKNSQIGSEANRLFADTANNLNGITRAQEEAMLAGSLFGLSH